MAKNNTTFGFMLANHPNRFGYYPVMLRITRNRQTKRVKTDLEVKKADWNQKARDYKHFRSSNINASVYNDMLSTILAKYKESYIDLKEEGNATSENIIKKVKTGEVSDSFFSYAKEVTQNIYDTGGFRNWKKYNTLINKLTDFLKMQHKKDISFHDRSRAPLTRRRHTLLRHSQVATSLAGLAWWKLLTPSG